MIRLEWITESDDGTMWLAGPGGHGGYRSKYGWASDRGWSNWVGDAQGGNVLGSGSDLDANKAACEASVKQSIRELSAWVEQEDGQA